MSTLLYNSYLVKVSTIGEGVKNSFLSTWFLQTPTKCAEKRQVSRVGVGRRARCIAAEWIKYRELTYTEVFMIV